MSTLLIAIAAGVGFIVAYHTYGRWLGRRIFQLSADRVVPSVELNDDRDYVPTSKGIVFGHHFTSIAGTGPIVGPAIAVIWGWLPALLWVVFGSILIGAVHDFGALVVSLRNKGQTVGDVAGRVINKRVRLLFLLVLFMALTVVLAIFGLVIAAVFKMFPASIFPCLIQIPIAVAIGVWLHRKGMNLLIPSILALGVMYLTVMFGDWGPLHAFNAWAAGLPIIVWCAILLAYSYVASVLPVWTLLQPRDYINSLQLITALGLVVVGLVVAAFAGGAPPVEGAARQPLEIVAPAVRDGTTVADLPLMMPFLFITIACGAISGFHCLVSSGTSSKQLKCETDAQFVGYGSMLTEGFLATVVILACVAGLGLGTSIDLEPPEPNMVGWYEARYQTADGQHWLVGTGRWGPFEIHAIDEADTVPHQQAEPKFSHWGKYGLRLPGQENQAVSFPAADIHFERTDDIFVTGAAAYSTRYASWSGLGGLAPKVGAFVEGSANFLKAMGIPAGVAIALMGVLVASFAGTTLDTATRLQRYVVQELARTFDTTSDEFHAGSIPDGGAGWNPVRIFQNAHGATIFAVGIALAMAALPAPGKEWSLATAGMGGMILWPLFGATNQLLGGLAFLVITFWLWRRRLPVWFAVVPMVFMLVMPAWAMGWQMFVQALGSDKSWLEQGNWLLMGIGGATLILEAWMIVEAALVWPRVRGVLEGEEIAVAVET